MMSAIVYIFVAVALGLVVAQDPAGGWLGYAAATYPKGTRLTNVEAKWVVLDKPKIPGAFYSPWFGIESSDNLNLIQPVNPWSGSAWSIYNEYFQWQPESNYNSDSHEVNPGDVLYGKVTYNAETNAYDMYHSDMTSGWSVNSSIPIQRTSAGAYKTFTIVYFVFEKKWPLCALYPPNNAVTFYDIVIEYDGQEVTPVWNTSYVDDVCNNRAAVLNNTAVQITWKS